jgi:hypothetical protein
MTQSGLQVSAGLAPKKPTEHALYRRREAGSGLLINQLTFGVIKSSKQAWHFDIWSLKLHRHCRASDRQRRSLRKKVQSMSTGETMTPNDPDWREKQMTSLNDTGVTQPPDRSDRRTLGYEFIVVAARWAIYFLWQACEFALRDTRHSASVRSVWYRVTGRLCCCRVVGVHMANPRLVGEPPPGIMAPGLNCFKNRR